MGPANFAVQKQFALLITALVGAHTNASFSAVQYGTVNIPISKVDSNVRRFIDRLELAQYADARRTFVAAGLGYCITQLGRKRGEANKIVLFGDGSSSLGDEEGVLGTAGLAKYWRNMGKGNTLCTVRVGGKKDGLFRNVVGGDRRLILEVEDWAKVINVLRTVLREVCDVAPEF